MGERFRPIPAGSRLICGEERQGDPTAIQAWRKAVAASVRSAAVGTPISVKLSPMDTCRQPPLDHFGKELMKSRERGGPPKRFETIAKGKNAQEIRDLLLIALWDALFLPACEHWTTNKVVNTTSVDAWELGWWFQKGQEICSEPIFTGICVSWLTVLRRFGSPYVLCFVRPALFGSRLCAAAFSTNSALT